MKSRLPQCFVPVRYAHLHCALGEADSQQQQSTTMFKSTKFISGLAPFAVLVQISHCTSFVNSE